MYTAQASPWQDWEVSVVVDAATTSRALELDGRDSGIQLGHSDLSARGSLGKAFSAEASIAAETSDGRLEHHVENLWIQTKSLPDGLQARLGRFASQIGYLNEQHPHADDFTERPLLYRGFLGGHWYDDGVRLNWVAPLPFYLRLGLEAFSGKQLIEEAQSSNTIGARTFTLKTGADLDAASSWQFGLSYLNNRRQAEAHEHGETSEEAHAHGAEFSGGSMWMTDIVYKWSPGGSSSGRQLRLIGEYARISDIYPDSGSLRHTGSSLAAIWRFRPSWEVGVRADWLKVNKPELHAEGGAEPEVEFASARLREQAVMLAWRPSHQQTYRLQLSRQKSSGTDADEVFPNPSSKTIQFQVVFGFGAHGAHSY
jgi:hypothetical protein